MTDSTKQVDQDIRTATQATNTSLGTDGTGIDPGPPPLGTGVRGWLRSIYVKLTGSITTLESSGLVPKVFDFVDAGYDASNRLTTAVFKSGGTTVATLTIVYVGTSSRVDTVTRT